MQRAPFGVRLAEATATLGPLCVGIDPHPELLRAWGLPVDPDGLRRFARTCVEAFAGHVAVVKPQSAFFEEYGSAGIQVLEETLAAFRGSGTLTLLDVKRGDIGSTMAGYGRAYLADGSPLAADALSAMQGGQKLNIIFASSDGQPITLAMSLAGFTAALQKIK